MRTNQRHFRQRLTTPPANQNFGSTFVEQRWTGRKSGRTPALIVGAADVVGRRAPPLNGIIMDVSPTGARIALSRQGVQRFSSLTPALPERLSLQIGRLSVEVDCRIAWYEEAEIGVQFVSPMRKLMPVAKAGPLPKKAFRMSLANLFAS